MNDKIKQWLTINDHDDLPEWVRCVAVTEQGEVFLPAAIAGNENAIFMCAAHDGVGFLVDKDSHVYVPASWMIEEYPRVADACRNIVSGAMQAVRDD